jgi:hypothetical protein
VTGSEPEPLWPLVRENSVDKSEVFDTKVLKGFKEDTGFTSEVSSS